jgi:hypothetical protein
VDEKQLIDLVLSNEKQAIKNEEDEEEQTEDQ